MNIVVVGAGIGGLAFALSAHRLGMSVQVYESVSEFPFVEREPIPK
jgi:2-polyprenyl-6-methoxyphenol hydroxylase-like FAD-dependent oxidoreductase